MTTTEDVIRLLMAQRELNFRPGSEFMYVNSNYALLALICERVNGQPFSAFCHDRIFGPLEMDDSVINDSVFKIIPGRASGYYEEADSGWLNAPLVDSVVGPTNVYTTVEDLAKWDRNFYTGQVGGQALVERMHQPGHLNDGTELDYALGLMVGPTHQHRGWQVVEHGGGQGGYGAWMLRVPELRLSIVVLFNHFLWEMQDYALKVADLFLEDKQRRMEMVGVRKVSQEAPAPVELCAEQLEAKAGKYFNAARAAVREVIYAEGRLRYGGLDLVPLSENLFFFDKEPHTQVQFLPGTGGAPAGMKTITPSGEYGYDRVESVLLSPEELACYEGRFYSPELDICWTIFAGDDCLVASRRKYVDSELAPLFRDAFSDDWLPLMGYPTTYLVVFERDARDRIAALRVSGTRVRNLRFVKDSTC
jgi:hypothetical protein